MLSYKALNTSVFITIINIKGESIKDDLLLEFKETFKELFFINFDVNLVPIKSVNTIISLFYNSFFISYISVLSCYKVETL
jgi:hypothetical protein